MRTSLALLLGLLSPLAAAETVVVKYHGRVVLDAFACNDIAGRSNVTRVCYVAAEQSW